MKPHGKLVAFIQTSRYIINWFTELPQTSTTPHLSSAPSMDNPVATTPLDSLRRSDRLWYEDADMVFCAGEWAFRVHRSILSVQSPIFRDMLALPQGKGEIGNTSKAKNKSPRVITLPDSGEDLYYFFLAIFDNS